MSRGSCMDPKQNFHLRQAAYNKGMELILLDRSYFTFPCKECESITPPLFQSDTRCAACGFSPKMRIQEQRRLEK
jgi:ribosomal protein L37E